MLYVSAAFLHDITPFLTDCTANSKLSASYFVPDTTSAQLANTTYTLKWGPNILTYGVPYTGYTKPNGSLKSLHQAAAQTSAQSSALSASLCHFI